MNKIDRFLNQKLLEKENNLHMLQEKNVTKTPLVSVHCLTFNHEKYIARCLDSILMQMVDFDVEILVHDDCSTDKTAKIIKEYQKKYPNIIKPIFEKENIYSRTNNFVEIAEILFRASTGKYIAFCEGDDYWTNQYKLFYQANILEKYQKCSFCVHRVSVKTLSSDYKTDGQLPLFNMKSSMINDLNFIALISDRYAFQTSSYFFKKTDYSILFSEKPLYMKIMPTFDEVILRHCGSSGVTCFLNKIMSEYSQYNEGSWSNNHKKQNNKDLRLACFEAVKEFDVYSNKKYHKSCEKMILKNQVYLFIQNKEYSLIFNNKRLRKTLMKIDPRTYFSLKVKKFFGKIKL